MNKKRNKTYERVMPRVYNISRSSIASNSVVMRHDSPSSVRVGAKPSASHVSSAAFSELPTVLNDYVPEDNIPKPLPSARMTKVVKPRRTVKSLDTSKSPPRTVTKSRSVPVPRILRGEKSTPALRRDEGWTGSHVRQCYSSRSHTRLNDLKDEIKAYRETEKYLRWRSEMYKKCGVVFDEDGHVAADKAVQADVEREKDPEEIR
ncbi:hypothetical protein O0L34_g17545 [Tuta absoluta]|nr:hypothetical protein O0L34_g17545 [Tuta absoluta]